MPDKKTKRWYSKQLDILFPKVVKLRNRCQRCGSTHGSFECAHIVGRDDKRLRHDIRNALCLCNNCHVWAHREPGAFKEWFKAKYPDREEYLTRIRGQVIKLDEDYYINLYKQYQNILEQTWLR